MSDQSQLAAFADQPFELLRQMEARARSADVQIQRARNEWVGVGISIDGMHYLIPQTQVLEILKKPNTTRVPGSRRWMIGLSNVRGTLFPVIDVRLYCGDEPTVIGRDSRIVLINCDPAPVAIVVDEVHGFRRFTVKMSGSKSRETHSPLDEYVQGVFEQDDTTWSVLDVLRLISTGGVLATTH